MLKAELQKALKKAKKEVKDLTEENAERRQREAELERDIDEARKSINMLQTKFMQIDEEYYALKTVRMPHLELENESLKRDNRQCTEVNQQLERICARRGLETDQAYEVIQNLIQDKKCGSLPRYKPSARRFE